MGSGCVHGKRGWFRVWMVQGERVCFRAWVFSRGACVFQGVDVSGCGCFRVWVFQGVGVSGCGCFKGSVCVSGCGWFKGSMCVTVTRTCSCESRVMCGPCKQSHEILPIPPENSSFFVVLSCKIIQPCPLSLSLHPSSPPHLTRPLALRPIHPSLALPLTLYIPPSLSRSLRPPHQSHSH